MPRTTRNIRIKTLLYGRSRKCRWIRTTADISGLRSGGQRHRYRESGHRRGAEGKLDHPHLPVRQSMDGSIKRYSRTRPWRSLSRKRAYAAGTNRGKHSYTIRKDDGKILFRHSTLPGTRTPSNTRKTPISTLRTANTTHIPR